MNIRESVVKKVVNEVVSDFLLRRKVHEVKYFHPNGNNIPNGSHYQRGGFIKECIDNKNAFVLDESVHGEQYGLAKYRGGIITLSTDINAIQMSRNVIINKIKQVVETFKQRFGKDKIIHNTITDFNNKNDEYIGAYSVGNFFGGRYVGDNGEMYNEKSISIEVNGLSRKSLFKLAENLCGAFRQETVLVKDLNNNKIFLVDNEDSDNSLESEMERINTAVD